MAYKPGDTYYGEFTTCRFDTGAVSDADSPPLAVATRNGTDDVSFLLSSTKIDVGRYKVSGNIPTSYVSGDSVQISISATVGAVAGKAVIDGFVLDGKRISDLNDAAASPTAVDIRAELDAHSTKLANLDAAVSSRPTSVAIRTELDTNSTKLANLDAAVSSRSTFSGGPVASVQNPVAVDLTQAVSLSNAANSLGDCLNAARAQGFGKWSKVGSTLTLYGPDGTTIVRSFSLDDGVNPTSRS